MTSDQPTRIVLIRHGESVSTVSRRIGGHRTCGGLSPLGREQAERLRDRLARTGEVRADVLITSHYPRARETAEIIAPALDAAMSIEMAGFGEHDPGDVCDGMTFDDFVAAHGERDWEDPWGETFPGGETVAAFHFRVGTALHEILGRYAGSTIVIACHGGVIDAAFRILLRLPGTGAFRLRSLNTAVTEFELVSPRTWQLLRYNDSAHLAGLPAETVR